MTDMVTKEQKLPFRPGEIVRHDGWPPGETRIVLDCHVQPLPPQLDRGVTEFGVILDRPAFSADDPERPDMTDAERECMTHWMAAGLRRIGALPRPEVAASHEFEWQLDYTTGISPPCFHRGGCKEHYERWADEIRAEGQEAYITRIPDPYPPALLKHYESTRN